LLLKISRELQKHIGYVSNAFLLGELQHKTDGYQYEGVKP